MSKTTHSPNNDGTQEPAAAQTGRDHSGGGTAAGAAAASGAEPSQRILVVDDEAQIRELLSVYLQRQGYLTVTAGTSAETLRVMPQTPVDLVVLDIGLDGEDGLDLLIKIKAAHPQVLVVMLTGLGFVEDLLEAALQKGADGYVSKVLPLDELLMTIQRLLRRPGQAADAA